MSQPKTLNVSHLPSFSISDQAPLWWGQISIVAIEGMMFSILIAAYFYTRLRLDVWPPPGTQLPHVLLPTVALVPLILSAFAGGWASRAAKKNDRSGMIMALTANLVLALTFFAMRVVEWHSFNFNWQTDLHGSYVWAFLGLHSFDYIASMVETLVLLLCVATGRYGQRQRLGIHVDSVLWNFIVAMWIPIYIVIYWGPRIVGT